MDDDEDFRALYFNECEDLLEDLQNHLGQILEGEGDEESIHAAFRAVHSVKGGAAAFGFDQLITFAHTFEAVMDLTRSGQLDISTDLGELFLRASDAMESLITMARDEEEGEVPSLATVMAELKRYLGEEPESAPAAAAAPAAPAAPPKASTAAPEAPVETAEPEEVIEEERTVHILFKPMDSFFESGFDMLKIIESAKENGLVDVEAVGELGTIEDFALDICPLQWRFRFETPASDDELSQFFTVYEAAAEFEIEASEEPPEPEPTPEKAAEPKEAPAKAEAAPAVPNAPAADAAPPPAASAEPAEKSAKKPKPTEKKPAKANNKAAEAKSLRIDLLRVDRLVNLVGEIAITQASLVQTFSESEHSLDSNLEQTIDSLSRQTRDLQDSVMAIRAQPVKVVFSRMPRVIRELCDTLGKKVKLEIEGEHTEVDTTIIEELSEPLIHMLRNSMDHGLETPEKRRNNGKNEVGRILLKAEHRGERVMITIQDDGAGINREVVQQKAYSKGLISQDEKLTPEEIDNLIFHPGFSTAETVSSVSGRGVGMDVVRKKIVELGGRCTLKNEPGQGCTFTIALPLTLAVLDGMTISVAGERFILPLSNVVEATFLSSADVRRLPDNSEVLARRGEYLKLLSVRNAFSMDGTSNDETMAVIVDTETDGHVALRVDELLGQRQVVLKSIESNYRRVEGVSGATILGDGRVALIIDVPTLIELSGSSASFSPEALH